MEKDNNQRAFGPFFLSIEDVRPHLLNPALKESDMVHFIKEMSAKFTKKRDQIGDYVLDDDHVASYAALYLTTNIPKLHFLLSKLPADVLEDIINRPFVDIGCGPGTFSLGISLLFEKTPPEVICVDSSKVMLDQAEKILKGFFSNVNLKTFSRFSEKKTDSVLFYGHSINEMGIQKVQDQVMMVDPEYVVFIEPGTSELFLELKKLREALLDSYEILYPCPSSSACPNQWCHQVLRTSHDQSVERLSQLVSLDRKIMPMTAHVYRRKQKIETRPAATIIRFINETKFSFEYEVCFFEEGENKNAVIEIQKKQLSKEQEKAFKHSNVGDRIRFEVERIVGTKLRVKIL